MASGFLTNDGKDLDSRYLGINAKAASAKTADTATTATTATNVTNKGTLRRNGAVVYAQLTSNGTYSVPANGVIAAVGGGMGVSLQGNQYSAGALYVNAGDVITGSKGAAIYLCKTTIS